MSFEAFKNSKLPLLRILNVTINAPSMANPFYARYLPPPISIVKKEPDVDFDPNLTHDRAQLIKRRKTKSGFKPTGESNEEKAESPDEFDVSIIDNSSARVPETNKGKKKKEREHGGKSDSLAASTSSNSVPDGKDTPRDSALKEETANSVVEDIDVKESEKKGKKEKKKKKHSSAAEGDANDTKFISQNDSISDETKHKKIRAKYEKAAEVSAQATENVNASQVNGLEEHQREPASPIEIHGLVPLPQPPQIPEMEDNATFSALPDWLTHPIHVSSSATISLENLNLSPGVLTSLKQKGYQDAFAIQAAVLPLLLPESQEKHSGDICISAATGSGKTLAYTLPIIENLRDKPVVRLRGLIVVPTRELLFQVRECLQMCGVGSGLKIGTAVGSKSLKEEQELLVEKRRKYDPDAYQAEKEKLSAEDEELTNWDIEDTADGDDFECLENYVVDYSSKVDLLICTPGRLVDHVKSTKGFTLNHVQWLVIDEADRLLDESFQQWVEIVMPALEHQAPPDPLNDRLLNTFHLLRPRIVRKIILSATMTRDISKLTALKLRQPKLVVLETTTREVQDDNPPGPNQRHLDSQSSVELPPTLKEVAIPVNNTDDKPLYLIEILEQELGLSPDFDQPSKKDIKSQISPASTDISTSDSDEASDYSNSRASSLSSSHRSKSPTFNLQLRVATPPLNVGPTYGTLIFTNNNENANRLAVLLTLLRPSWDAQIETLTKSTSSAGGRRTLAQFRARKLSILIASDRASRGLDIPHLAHVINYDLPTSVTAYVHRVGRTARAGRHGRATTLVAKHEAHWFWNKIARAAGGIVRAAGRKVERAESRLVGWGEDERKAYVDTLKRLGQEVKGG